MRNISELNTKDVILVKYPYEENDGRFKRRPAIIIDKNEDILEVLVVKVTSKPPRDKYDYRLIEWVKAQLSLPSTARASKLQQIKLEDIILKIGTVEDVDFMEILERLNEYINQ